MGLPEFGENGAYVAQGGNMRPPGSVADCVGSSGNREISRRISETPRGPRAVGLRHLLGFLLICRNSANTGPTWRGGANYAAPRISGRSRRIFRKSRYFSANLRNFHMSHARRVCAVYSDFSGCVGVRRKRGLHGAAGRSARPPGSVAVYAGSSGNREIPRRFSETSPCPRAVALRHLLGFLRICRNSAKTGPTWRAGRNMRPPGPMVDRVESS